MKNLNMINSQPAKRHYQQPKNDPETSDRIYSFCLLVYCSSLRFRFDSRGEVYAKSTRTIEKCLEITCQAFLDIKDVQIPNLDKYHKWLRENNLTTWDSKLAYFNNKPDKEQEIMESAWIDIPLSQQRPRKNGRIIEE